MNNNTKYTLAVVIIAIIILIPFAYGMFHAAQPIVVTPVPVATSTVATTTPPTSTVSPAHPIKPVTTSQPYIQYVTPTSAHVGDTVTLSGSGFAATGNMVLFGTDGVISDVGSTQSGTVLSFTVPTEVAPYCQPGYACAQYMRSITPGDYSVTIKNDAGTSNTFSFKVIATPTTQPTISSLSPSSGQVGVPVTIYGTGFLPTNTILFDGGPINNISAARNGTALTFTVPSSVGADCQPNQACPMYAKLVGNGVNTVSVRNTNGTSNTATFTVTGGTTPVPSPSN